jgi:diadenosine tetraphosphatase ApaH/serine/threonine PP2A family protein phosphatase
MRLAILADIHGNLPAFEAVLYHISQQKVDQIIVAGDMVVGAPDSKACLELAMSLGCPILRGNHERYIAHYGTPNGSPRWATEQYAPLQWAVAQFSEQECKWMAQLPPGLRIPEAPDLFIVHASERDDHDTIEPHTPELKLKDMFPMAQESYIVRAHNHYGQVRIWEKGYIITSGSVGLPLDGNPTAQYLLLDKNQTGWKIQHQSVPYNIEAAISRFYDTNYFSSAGPMGRLFFRELITASQQIVPFLRLYTQWSKKSPISLAQAVDRFLNF